MSEKRTIWLFSPWLDNLCFYLPLLLVWGAIFLLGDRINSFALPDWAWVVFILGIDVSHVWSTIFRTYLDKEERKEHKRLLWLTPLLASIPLLLLAYFGERVFWVLLAYLAVFHFIKQQFGFCALYSWKYGPAPKTLLSDKWIIYLATLYPIVYWHLKGDRIFDWFVTDDFNWLEWPLVHSFLPITNLIYWGLIAFWLLEQWFVYKAAKLPLPIGKILWVLFTAFNWYMGIVYFNSDLVFSVSNVVAHGIPYIALIAYYQSEKNKKQGKKRSFVQWAAIMTPLLILLAFLEEILWDILVNHEKGDIFGLFIASYEHLHYEGSLSFAFLAFLSIPQVTHYILDGFIWKNNKSNPWLARIFSHKYLSSK